MTVTTRVFLPPRSILLYCLWAILPSGTLSAPRAVRVEASLLTPISRYFSKTGMAVRALVTTPLCSEEGAVPEGAILIGKLMKVRRVGLGLVHERASLEPAFENLEMPDGRVIPVGARLQSVDNARERVDDKGKVHGIRATAALSNRAGERLIFLAMGHPFVMLPVFALETGLFHFPDPEIEFPRGTEMYFDLQTPGEWGLRRRFVLAEAAGATAEEMDELEKLVADLPYWSYSKRQRQPLDLVNLVYVGSRQAVESAFQAADWTGARSNSASAGFGAIRALAERNADGDAPMRTLLLDNSEPVLGLQKTFNTFEMRHHLRIWQRSNTWRGQPVWASAATQDIAATFSMKPFGFTHEIQNQVDLERDKVVSDLVYTGCVDSVTYVARPETVRASGQDYRRGVNTDARVAVVELNACEQPRLDLADGPSTRLPSRFVRVFRRVTLTARNHFIRDNWFWRGYEAAHMSYGAIRNWKADRRDERLASDHDRRLKDQQRGPVALSQNSEAGAAFFPKNPCQPVSGIVSECLLGLDCPGDLVPHFGTHDSCGTERGVCPSSLAKMCRGSYAGGAIDERFSSHRPLYTLSA